MGLIDCFGKSKFFKGDEIIHFANRSEQFQKEGLTKKEADLKAISEAMGEVRDTMKNVYEQVGKPYLPKEPGSENLRTSEPIPPPNEEPPQPPEGGEPERISTAREENVTGIKKAITEPIRASKGLPVVDIPKMGKDAALLKIGKDAVDSGKIDPVEMVDRINREGGGYHSEEEAAAMQYHAHQLSVMEELAAGDLASAKTEDGKAMAVSNSQQVNDLIESQTRAARIAGNQWGVVGNIMQIEADPNFSPARERSFIRENYGGEIPKDVQERLAKAETERDLWKKKYKEREGELGNEAASGFSKSKRSGKIADIKKKRGEIIDDIKKKLKEQRGRLSANPIPVELIPDITRLALNYADEGLTRLQDYVDKIHDDLKEFIEGVSKDDVKEMLTKAWLSYQKGAGRKKFEQKVAIIEKGDFAPKPQKGSLTIPKDNKLVGIEDKIRRAEHRIKQEKIKSLESGRSKFQRGLDWAVRWRRRFALSGTNVWNKLGSAVAVGGMAIREVDEAIGGIYSAMFTKVAEKAPIEGFYNVKAEVQFWKESMNIKQRIKNWGQIAKTGSTDLSKKYGEKFYQHYAGYDIGIDTHVMIKDALKEPVFYASLEKGLRWAEKNNLNIHDPLVHSAIEYMAFKKASYAIFNNDNSVSTWFNTQINKLRSSKHPADNLLAAMVGYEIPVNKVPVNIASRLGLAVTGLPRGLANLHKAYKNGIENLTNEEAEIIMRQLKTGSIGSALVAIGVLGYGHFGGLWNKDEKSKPGDLGPNEMEVFGVKLSEATQHALPLMLMQYGATIRRIYDSYDGKGESKPISFVNALTGSTGAVLEQIPMIETPVEAVEAFKDPKAREKFLENQGRSIVPQIVAEQAKRQDVDENGEPIKRQVKSVPDAIKNAIPGLRETLPEKTHKTFTIYDKKTNTQRQATKEEYEKFIQLRDQYKKKALQDFKLNKVWLDRYGNVTVDDKKIHEFKNYDDLTDDQKRKLESLIAAQSARKAENEMQPKGDLMPEALEEARQEINKSKIKQ